MEISVILITKSKISLGKLRYSEKSCLFSPIRLYLLLFEGVIPITNCCIATIYTSNNFDSVDEPLTFKSRELLSMQEHFQALLKRRLEVQIESHPPLFPWEVEVTDYSDCPNTSSIKSVRSIDQGGAVGISTAIKCLFLLFLWIILPAKSLSYAGITAERIYLSYATGEVSISVKDLEKFVQTNVTPKAWRFFQGYVSSNQLQELRRILVAPVKVHPVAMANFLYSPQGEVVLQRLAKVIRAKSRQSQVEIYSLRTALILASQEQSGLTLLNVLRKYPTSSIRIDLVGVLRISTQVERIVDETNQILARVAQKSDIEAAAIKQSINLSQLPDIRQSRKLKVRKQTLRLHDLSRQRLLLTDIYLPQVRNKVPIIVISHGLGTDSSNFAYLANHLATYGFGVIVPNHSHGLLKRRSINEVIKTDEFYHRPLDVKYILDELSKSKFQSRLNLQEVGVFGQSFGGYTALALAGAKLNVEEISKNCDAQTLENSWNMSLFLQCRLRAWYIQNPKKKYNFRDRRVKAVVAVNPFTSIVFGKAGLSQVEVPVMVVASSDDIITPAAYEQILPFSWITHTHKFLVVLFGGTHFSTIGDGQDSLKIESASELIGDNPHLARSYMNTLTAPFFLTYVMGKVKYGRYLNAAYAKQISHPVMGLGLTQMRD